MSSRPRFRAWAEPKQLLTFYDVHADCLVGEVRKRKRVDDPLAVFARLRAAATFAVSLTSPSRWPRITRTTPKSMRTALFHA